MGHLSLCFSLLMVIQKGSKDDQLCSQKPATWIQSNHLPPPVSLRSTLILSTSRSFYWLSFLLSFPQKPCAHSLLVITFGEAYTLWISSLCSSLQPPIHPFLGPNTLSFLCVISQQIYKLCHIQFLSHLLLFKVIVYSKAILNSDGNKASCFRQFWIGNIKQLPICTLL